MSSFCAMEKNEEKERKSEIKRTGVNGEQKNRVKNEETKRSSRAASSCE